LNKVVFFFVCVCVCVCFCTQNVFTNWILKSGGVPTGNYACELPLAFVKPLPLGPVVSWNKDHYPGSNGIHCHLLTDLIEGLAVAKYQHSVCQL